MAIQLNEETQRLIEKEVEAGRFPDAAAFVGAAVRHFLITREDLGYTREEIDAMIGDAIASIERGEGADGEEFFAALEKEEAEGQRRGR
jgi:Arc/MetJ-type ribon-helix-helix transcriptional regulator